MEKRLYRSRSERVVGGVCGGLAKYLDVDPTLIRIIAVLLVLTGGVGIFVYIILAIIIPLESTQSTAPRDVIRENVAEIKETATRLGREIQSALTREEGESKEAARIRQRRLTTLGAVLILLGVLFLLGSLNITWWLGWRTLWPLILVAIGVLIILNVRRV